MKWALDVVSAAIGTMCMFAIGAVVDPYFDARSSWANVALTFAVALAAIRGGRWLGQRLLRVILH